MEGQWDGMGDGLWDTQKAWIEEGKATASSEHIFICFFDVLDSL